MANSTTQSGHGDSTSRVNSVVIVHGAFADGSGWRGVYDILKRAGFEVSVVQNPVISLDGDVKVTKEAIAAATGEVILVGHSYGGVVITEAGTDDKVAGLVYVAAFVPDAGESAGSLSTRPAPGYGPPPFALNLGSGLTVDPKAFPEWFAGDVPAAEAEFMAISQVPWGDAATTGTVTDPAWKHKPTWCLLSTNDRMIPPPTQQFMTKRAGAQTQEVASSHAMYVSHPDIVAATIKQAAETAKCKHQ